MRNDQKTKKRIDPNKIKIGDVVLVASGTKLTIKVQEKLGFGTSSKWTHVAGSIGGYDLVEGQVPKSRICNLQKDYIEKGIEIRIMRHNYLSAQNKDRIKVALWWASMNNLPYDYLQLLWFPLAAKLGKLLLFVNNIFNSKKRKICSELIADGFYKQGYNLFNKPIENIMPADYDDPKLFDIIADIWI
jgi:hypothetical protein